MPGISSEKNTWWNSNKIKMILLLSTIMTFLTLGSFLIYLFVKVDGGSLTKKVDSLLFEEQQTKQDLVEQKNTEQAINKKPNGEAWVAFIALGTAIGGLFVAVGSLFVTYFFSKKIYEVSENATQFAKDATDIASETSYREEKELYLQKIPRSLGALNSMNELLVNAKTLLEFNYRWSHYAHYNEELDKLGEALSYFYHTKVKVPQYTDSGAKEILRNIKNQDLKDIVSFFSDHYRSYGGECEGRTPIYITNNCLFEKDSFEEKLSLYQLYLGKVLVNTINAAILRLFEDFKDETNILARVYLKTYELRVFADKLDRRINELLRIEFVNTLNTYKIYCEVIEQKDRTEIGGIKLKALVSGVDPDNLEKVQREDVESLVFQSEEIFIDIIKEYKAEIDEMFIFADSCLKEIQANMQRYDEIDKKRRRLAEGTEKNI